MGAWGKRNISSRLLEILKIHSSFQMNPWVLSRSIGHWDQQISFLIYHAIPNNGYVCNSCVRPFPVWVQKETRQASGLFFLLKRTNTGKCHTFKMAKNWIRNSPLKKWKKKTKHNNNNPKSPLISLLVKSQIRVFFSYVIFSTSSATCAENRKITIRN